MPAVSIAALMSDPLLRRESIAKAKAGDRAALEEVLEAYGATVLRTAQRLLLNDADASDAAQEVFVRLHRKLPRFDEERDILPWLYRMTVNICHDLRRKRKPLAGLAEITQPASRELGPEEALNQRERRELLYEALGSLTEREREAVVLRHLEEFSTAEVAEILGSTEGTIRSQISTGRAKLRNCLERVLGRDS
jgi:RNA polymerase sigma-70 factor (ECF subfamily)